VDVYSGGMTLMMLLLYHLLPRKQALVIEKQQQVWEYVDELQEACQTKVKAQENVDSSLQRLCMMALKMTKLRCSDRPTIARLRQYFNVEHKVSSGSIEDHRLDTTTTIEPNVVEVIDSANNNNN
jgi:hypothetical protein